MFKETGIKDLLVFEPRVFEDDRGYFFESYSKKLFSENGIDTEFVQDNQSLSSYGTVRGLHMQKGEYSQAKLVRVIEGSVLDVAVDLRPNSDTFGKCFAIELSAENKKQLFVPRGFAHGFATLSPKAIFAYKCDNLYNKESEVGIMYNDVDLNINWKISTEDMILSEKDLKNLTLNEFKKAM